LQWEPLRPATSEQRRKSVNLLLFLFFGPFGQAMADIPPILQRLDLASQSHTVSQAGDDMTDTLPCPIQWLTDAETEIRGKSQVDA
jgi:hypothetical protein